MKKQGNKLVSIFTSWMCSAAPDVVAVAQFDVPCSIQWVSPLKDTFIDTAEAQKVLKSWLGR